MNILKSKSGIETMAKAIKSNCVYPNHFCNGTPCAGKVRRRKPRCIYFDGAKCTQPNILNARLYAEAHPKKEEDVKGV